jgi:hypothetical protein
MKPGNIFYVYVLFRPWNGEPFYIGKGQGDRWLHHERRVRGHYNPHLTNVIKKARKLQLPIPKIKVREDVSETEAFEVEKALIRAVGRTPTGPLVNLTDGGDGPSGNKTWVGRHHKPETKIKMREAKKGRHQTPEHVRRRVESRKRTIHNPRGPHSPEHRANIGKAGKGRIHSEETKRKIAASHIGKTHLPETIEKLRTIKLGTKHSPETRAKISASLLGNKRTLGFKFSPESRAKMSKAHTGNHYNLGKKWSKKTRAKHEAVNKARRAARKRQAG